MGYADEIYKNLGITPPSAGNDVLNNFSQGPSLGKSLALPSLQLKPYDSSLAFSSSDGFNNYGNWKGNLADEIRESYAQDLKVSTTPPGRLAKSPSSSIAPNAGTTGVQLETYKEGLGFTEAGGYSELEPITAANYDPSMMTASPDGKGLIHTETGQFVPNETIAAFSKPKEVWGGMTGAELVGGGLQVAGLANSFIQGERNRGMLQKQIDELVKNREMAAAEIGYDDKTKTSARGRANKAVGAAFYA